MFAPKKEEFVDPVTGETKKRQVKYYPDAYKNRIGRSYTEYEQYRQLNLFEDFGAYNKEGKDGSIDLIGVLGIGMELGNWFDCKSWQSECG